LDLRFQRCKLLFGEDGFKKIQQTKVLILGVGGVGSYALDCLISLVVYAEYQTIVGLYE